jgi:thymidylate synthase
MYFDLRNGFPILTTKKILWHTIVDELLWFIRGGHNINDSDAPKRIWDDWADFNGELGRIYGVQWRDWKTYTATLGEHIYENASIDQLQLAISRLKNLPNSRRNIVSAWNVGDIEDKSCSFPPCHVLFQFRRYDDKLDMALYQRSGDVALGVPFNISSYALLMSMAAHECGLVARRFVHFIADAHVYTNHFDGLNKQLERVPKVLPKLKFLCPIGTPVVKMTKDDFYLQEYIHDPFIKFEVAV